jgi:DNA-binding response OmpR family regulator
VIKSDETLQDIKVFLLTARAMPSERQQGLDAGADAYITKPFANADLVTQVQNALGSSEAALPSPPEGTPGSGLPVLIKVRLVLRDELQREHVFSTTIHPELAERKKES